MGIFAVDIDFGEEREVRIPFLDDSLLDFSISARLLSSKLIAREDEDFQSRIFILEIKLLELGVIGFC